MHTYNRMFSLLMKIKFIGYFLEKVVLFYFFGILAKKIYLQNITPHKITLIVFIVMVNGIVYIIFQKCSLSLFVTMVMAFIVEELL